MTDTAPFRPAVAADIPAIAAMWHAGWHDAHVRIVPDTLSRLRTLDSFTDRTTTHLPDTFVNDSITAMLMLSDDEVYQFYVAPNARGTGLATNLMRFAEDQMRHAAIYRPWLACSVGNIRAARFYEKSGWRRVGTQDLALETSGPAFTLTIWRYEKYLT